MASNRQTRAEPGQTTIETRGKAATEAGKERWGVHRGTRTDMMQKPRLLPFRRPFINGKALTKQAKISIHSR
ncbi:protein of unknown function [Paraburkholderia dioscoreae]|uniref:Uncharacterized protein n=1 Tax=Paraburkholderia dioscoreae TaxID=2604047 RepID=A0A5Q4Z8X3_9BURK|nr:protein of unknown function [Paraburkholderia dioscoreae]